MNCKGKQNATKYLEVFDKILNQMETKMLSQNIINNITIDFIRCMIPHHQAAIYMCQNLLNFTNYLPLQNIANKIIQTQTNGIEQMKTILTTTCGYESSTQDVNIYMSEYLNITRKMICKMRNRPRCININLNFVNEMIPHHEGAVQMCNNLLKYNIDPRLEVVARNIIEEQTKGIQELKIIRNNLCICGGSEYI